METVEKKEMEMFLLGEVSESSIYITTYEAYDKVKKCWCYLEVPNIKTSWQFKAAY